MTAESPGRSEPVRLQKFLARAGVASRRGGERLIEAGRVSVDGVVVTELGTKVRPGEHIVRVDGRRVTREPARWIVMYKPAGHLTTRSDDRGRQTVYELLPDRFDSLFHVGRLDRASEGVLILTNEGDLAHRLLHPSYEIPRRYRVEVDAPVDEDIAERLEAGIQLEDGLARAEAVEWAREGPGGRVGVIRLTLREGRKREIRRMMEALGLPVRRLIRVAFGPIEADGLEPGEWRELEDAELRALRACVEPGGVDGNT